MSVSEQQGATGVQLLCTIDKFAMLKEYVSCLNSRMCSGKNHRLT